MGLTCVYPYRSGSRFHEAAAGGQKYLELSSKLRERTEVTRAAREAPRDTTNTHDSRRHLAVEKADRRVGALHIQIS